MRKHLKSAVQANEQLFRSNFTMHRSGSASFSIDGRKASSNRACQGMLGCTEEELRQVENWDKMVHPDDRASGAMRYAELHQGKSEKDQWEQSCIRREGRNLITSARFTLLRNVAGKLQYVTSLTEDITERKAGGKGAKPCAAQLQGKWNK